MTKVTRSLEVAAEHVKPRDYIVMLNVTAVSVDNTGEFYTAIRYAEGKGRIIYPKVTIVMVHRSEGSDE